MKLRLDENKGKSNMEEIHSSEMASNVMSSSLASNDSGVSALNPPITHNFNKESAVYVF